MIYYEIVQFWIFFQGKNNRHMHVAFENQTLSQKCYSGNTTIEPQSEKALKRR